MFYRFDQNNSGGFYKKDLPEYLIIEADTPEEANLLAENIGIYFNGVLDGVDCPCCGDRWQAVNANNGFKEPYLFSKGDWSSETVIYFRNKGLVKVIYKNTNELIINK